MTGFTTIAGALLAAVSAAALANGPKNPEVLSVDGIELAAAEPIIVTGQRSDYGARSTSTATKTDTPVRDIPQALTVISAQQVKDQSLRSISEMLLFVPGATPGTGESNRDQFTLRGNNTTADLFIDGFRDDAQYFRDFYNIDRIEVLRGPNAMIFGRGGGGGIINRVVKRPAFANSRELIASTTSEGGFRLAGDLDQPIGSGSGLRLNALYEDGRSFRHDVKLKRYGANPTAAFQLSPATRLDVGYEYFHDRRTADRGVPAFFDRPLKGYDRTSFGDPRSSYSRADVNIGAALVEHDFGAGLSLRNRTSVARYDKFYQNIYPENLDEATSEVVLGAYNSRNDRTNAFNQTELVRNGVIAGIDQTLLFGVELGRQWSRNHRLSGTIVGGNRVPLSDPTVDVNTIYAAVASDANNRTRATIAAVYAQDQIRPAPWLEIVAGLRLDRFDLRFDDLRGTGSRLNRRDTLLSPRVGLILKPTPRLSFYGSLSRSFLPQSGDQFSEIATNTASLKPERFDNFELGAKWEPIDGLLATAAIYQLDRKNTRSVDPADQTRFVLSGAQRSRGIELGLERNITDRWRVSAGYALQKAVITETTTAAPAGRRVPLVPRHSLSLWSRYDFNRTLGAGIGFLARSKSYASLSNQVTLPGYARVDAALYYTLGRGVEAQLNLENLLGARYFPTAHNDNNIAPGAPRTAKVTLNFGF